MGLIRAADSLRGARYHDHDNQWALFGQIVRPGGDFGISNMTFELRKHYILVAGDSNARDLDLEVNSSNGKLTDVDADPTPVQVKNVESNGATLMIASVLDGN